MAVEIPPLIKPSRLRRRGGLLGECMAEFLGTFVLISFGCGVVAMAVAALPGSGRAATPTTIFLAAGDWLLITFGWAFAVVFGVYVAGGVSGAHLNPAVTLAMAIRRGFSWLKVLPFMLSQVVGAFAGAALVYLVYHDAISAYDQAASGPKVNGHTNATFSIFATFPAAYFHGGIWGPLIDQIVGTAFLLMLIAALIDLRNQAVKANLGPLLVGFVVAAIGMSYGANAGYAINPARDFGPRLLTYAAGWQSYAFPGSVSGVYSGYWWIPIVGPLVGGTIGILIYDLFIGDVLLVRSQLGELPEPGRARGTKEVDEEEY
ncbi:MIP/aquaporin family protein [Streptomyces sp. Ag109_G2-15]|uniref:MIP/aquaporin family protein n=1 Tax=Streptomyces sp. Ag109_G2-15 TaxID=1938850 RepID=UPI000BD2E602|nr:MIP family channel protein [Streptomyces sp. Ag109_G2-15]SOD85063.1 glycerol uptake facilitator protein [Streptomyces sp. Ag109_G2-15]